MDQIEPPQEGLLHAAQFFITQQTPFRVYARTSFALFLVFCLVTSGVGIHRFWQPSLANAQASSELQPQQLQKYNQGILARLEQEVVIEEEPAAPQVVAAVAKPKVVAAPLAVAGSLDEVISRWRAANPGVKLGVVVRELEGQGRVASYNGNTPMAAASLYKLFVAYYLYERIEAGTLDPNSTLGSDRTVQACIDAMILVSDNPCPVGIADTVGWATISNFAQSKGFSGTSLGNAVLTSAADGVEYMARLEAGQLMNAEHTAHMLSLMKNQIYRSGIPKGIPGSTVADKVGFYGGAWNDSAIVYGPKGKYALTIMTNGGGATAVASLATQIGNYLNQ